MNSVRKNIISIRIIAFLMALNIFNLSIDTPDAPTNGNFEDLTINDQETFVELFLETFLNLGDVIAEHDDPDSDPANVLDFKKILFQNIFYTSNFIREILVSKKNTQNDALKLFHIGEKDSPPPKIG